jgi:cell division protein FtsQ
MQRWITLTLCEMTVATPYRFFQKAAQVELPKEVRLLNRVANLLYGVAALLALMAFLVWFMHRPMFNVASMVIEGDLQHNSEPTIRANALPLLQGNFFTLNLTQAQMAFEKVPWVRRAVVHRVWPNRLRVELEEHVPVAFWATPDNDDQLVNSFGEVFDANLGDIEEDQLPVLKGPLGTSAQVLATYLQLKPLFAQLKWPLQTLAMSSKGSWQAEFDKGIRLELGRAEAPVLMSRVQRFIDSVPQLVKRYARPIVFADLRYNNGYALKLQGITTALPPTAVTHK